MSVLAGLLLAVLFYGFQAWMLIDALQRREWLWAILIGCSLFLWKSFGLTALLYFFLVYRAAGPAVPLLKFKPARPSKRDRIRDLEGRIEALDKPHLHAELGQVHLEDGDAKQAEACFREALNRDETDLDYHAGLGQALVAQDRFEEACPYLERVSDEDPRHQYGTSLMTLAEVYESLDDRARAIATWRRVLELNSYARARVQLAALLIQENERDEARGLLHEVIADHQHAPRFQAEKERTWVRRAQQLLQRSD